MTRIADDHRNVVESGVRGHYDPGATSLVLCAAAAGRALGGGAW